MLASVGTCSWILKVEYLLTCCAGAIHNSFYRGGYTRVRKQFKVPIAEMEGVQERLAELCQHVRSRRHNISLMRPDNENLRVVCDYEVAVHRARSVWQRSDGHFGGAGRCKGPMNLLPTNFNQCP